MCSAQGELAVEAQPLGPSSEVLGDEHDLEVATGKVTCQPRHCHQEFLRFLKHVARRYPRVQLHLV